MNQLDKINKRIIIPFLILMIFISPRFGKIRIQDIVILFSILFTIIVKADENKFFTNWFNKKNTTFSTIITFKMLSLLLLFITNLSMVTKGNIPLSPYIFYYLKEVQYFTLFLLVIMNYNEDIDYFRVFSFSLFIQIIVGVYQLISGNYLGYYAVGLFGESGPSQSGGVFFIAYSLYLSKVYDLVVNQDYSKKKIEFISYLLLSLISFVLVLMSISRVSMIASLLSSAYLLIKLLMDSQLNNIKILIYIIISILIVYITVQVGKDWFYPVFSAISARLKNIPKGIEIRLEKWKFESKLVFTKPIQLFFGRGSGYHNYVKNKESLNVDSNYLRIIFEQGIAGLSLFFVTIYKLFELIKLNNNKYLKTSWFMITIGLLFISITHEIFYVVKIAEIFWLYTGMIIGKILYLEGS